MKKIMMNVALVLLMVEMALCAVEIGHVASLRNEMIMLENVSGMRGCDAEFGEALKYTYEISVIDSNKEYFKELYELWSHCGPNHRTVCEDLGLKLAKTLR